MSLWAIGTPVSAVAVPAAIRVSASAACASVSARSTCRKAFRSLFSIRSRKWVASSVAETALLCRRADSSLMVLVCMAFQFIRYSVVLAEAGTHIVLVDHFRHQVQAVLGLGGDGLIGVAAIRFAGHVVAQAQRDVIHVGRQWMAQRGDAVGVNRLHLFGQREDAVQLLQRGRALLLAHLKLGQFGNAGYVG